MALTKQELMDVMVEERQILDLKEKAAAIRDAAIQAAETALSAALNQAATEYTLATQAAESRLLDLRRALRDDGGWSKP